MMERREGYYRGHPVKWQTASRRKKRSPCMQNFIDKSKNRVWQLAVPSWEKEFCLKIGLFTWENFLEAKKCTQYSNKIMDWNDSAAEEAFHRAKNRFFSQIQGLPPAHDDESWPDPDLYIDEINWDDDEKVYTELLQELEWARRPRSDSDAEVDSTYSRNDYVPDYYHIRIEDIEPTGWDIDVQEISAGQVLTGLIVGSN